MGTIGCAGDDGGGGRGFPGRTEKKKRTAPERAPMEGDTKDAKLEDVLGAFCIVATGAKHFQIVESGFTAILEA